MKTTTPSYFPRLFCVLAVLGLVSPVVAQDFRITTLTPNNAVVVEANPIVGDDRGGIAVSSSQVFLTGDVATGRFNRDTLAGGVSVGTVRDGLVANLANDTVYLLGNGSTPLAYGGGTFSSLLQVDGTTGAPNGTTVLLSSPIPLAGTGSTIGIFSGWNRIVVHNGTRAYSISLPTGTVMDLGAMSAPSHTGSENWAYWGVAETVGADTYIAYVRNSTTISRTKVPTGETSAVATFANLSDMASFTVSVAQNRWYFHHEGGSQFGSFAESLGYADATFISPSTAPEILTPPVAQIVLVGDSTSLSVVANGSNPLAYQWQKGGVDIAGATTATYSLPVATQADSGLYQVVITNLYGQTISPPVTLTVNPPDADTFKILSLTAANAVVINPSGPAGDDRGGLVVTGQKVFLRGDDAVGSFNLDLTGGLRLTNTLVSPVRPLEHDSLVSDLRAQKAYVLANGTTVLGITGGTATALLELDATTALPTGTAVTLSTPISLPGAGLYAATIGIFSGWGRIALHNGTNVYAIELATGTVTNLGAMARPTRIASESWACWGVVEYWGGNHYLVYARDAQNIVRTRVADGLTTVLGSFSNLNDLASFTVVPGLGRWYFHNETINQFTNFSNFGQELLGYADATYIYRALPATIASQPQSLTVTVGANATFSVSVAGGSGLTYLWQSNGVALVSETRASLTLTNAQLANSGDVFAVTVNDGGTPLQSGNATLTVLPNAAPTLVVPANVTVNEDAGSQTNLVTGLTAGAAHETNQTLTVTATSDNLALTGSIAANYAAGTATLRYTNVANAFGSALITVIVSDNGGGTSGGVDSATNTYTVTVLPVNDAPSATPLTNNVVVLEDNGPTTVPAFLSAFSAGPGETQGLSLSVANNNNSLFLVQPAISPAGDLAFAPAVNAFGSATVTYVLIDDGGTPNGGVDRSTNTFTITVTPVNDAPTLTFGVTSVNVLTNAGTFTTNLALVATVGPANEAASQTITNLSVSNDNAALFSVQPALALNGTLTFTVAGNVIGTANVSIRAQDSGGTLNGGVNLSPVVNVVINVGEPNQVPTFTLATNNVVVLEDSGAASSAAFLTSLSAGEVTQSVTNLTTSNNNSNLFSAQPTIALDGTLTFIPAANANGSATVTVRATDDGLASATGTQTFTLTVTPVNDAPSFALNSAVVPVGIAEDSGPQSFSLAVTNTSAGPANESAQTVTFLTSNTASNLFSAQPVIAANGTLTFTPAANAWGTVTVSVRAQDNGGTTNGGVDTSAVQTFTITITNLNDPPAITLATNSIVVLEDAGLVTSNAFLSLSPGPFNEPGTVTITSLVNNNPSLFSAPPAFDLAGNLTFTSAPNSNGVATVTVIAQDDTLPTGLFSTNSFTITVLSVNDAPTLTITNFVINVVTNSGGFGGVLGATTTLGAPNETDQGPVAFLITNNNNALFSTQPSANQGGSIGFSVAPGQQGTAILYVRVQDRGGRANGGVDVSDPVLVTVNVTPANAAPTFTLGATSINQLEDAGTITSNLFLTGLSAGAQPQDASQTVTLTVVNNNSNLFSAQPALSGTGTTRDLTFTPAADASGVATVTITATDNGAPPLSTVRTVTITVLSVNDAPVITLASNNIALENAGAQSLSGFATITTGPAAEATQTITGVSVSNDNTALFSVQPTLTGGTLAFTPVLNASGIATVTVIAQDNGGTANGGVDKATNTFTIAIAVVNQAPSFNLRLANTQASPIVNGSFETGDFTGWTVSDTANTSPSLAVRADGANLGIFNVVSTDGTKSATHGFGGTSEGIISIGQNVTVPANATAQATFTYRIAWNTLGSVATSNRVFRVSVQPAGGGAELGGSTLLTAAPNTFGVQPTNQSGSLDLTPYAGQTVRLAFVAIIPAGDTANGGFQLDNVSVTVNTPDFSVYENSGASSTLNYATNILAGPANEAGQALTFFVSNNNNALFSSQPAMAANGTLTFTPAADANGAATATVYAQDDGGRANGGEDTSTSRTFTITVLPRNSAPRVTVTLANVVVNEDSAAFSGTVATVLTGPADEASQSITNVVTSNDNNSLFSVQPSVSTSGLLTFTLAANQNGSATVSFTPQDNGGTANGGVNQTTRTLTITVTPVNDAPSFALTQPAGQPGGAYYVSTLAGSAYQNGTTDGTGVAARFFYSWGVVVDPLGNLYVAEEGGHTIRKITPAGVVTTFAGGGGQTGTDDGTGAAARFNRPRGLARDLDGNLYVADYFNLRLRKVTPAGVVTTVATFTDYPIGVALDSTGNIYVSFNTVIAKVTQTGVVTTLAGTPGQTGNSDGTGAAARFYGVFSLAMDRADNLYATDWANNRVCKITLAGEVTTVVSSIYCTGLTVDGSGNLYVGNGSLRRIEKVTPAGVRSTVAGSGTAGFADGLGTAASFGTEIMGLAFDSAGNLYATDFTNFLIRKLTPSVSLTVLEDSGAYTGGAAFATSVSPGPADESAQTVSFSVSNSNNPLFSSQPALAADGTLTFTPAANAFGSATVTVTAVDSGSGTPPNVNTSAAQTFTITVTNVNDRPSVTLAGNVTRNEDSGAHSQSSFATFSAGNASESGQAVLAYNVSNNNSSLFSVQPAISTSGVLTFTPAVNANGVATVTVSVQDNGGTANGGADTSAEVTFTITVNSVNDAPSFALNGGVLNTGSGGGGGSGDGLIVGGATYYPAGGTTVLVAPDLTYSNSVSSTTAGAAVSIDNGQTGDVLGFNSTLATSYGISGTYNSTTKVLSFTGSATTAQYQEVLRSVTYNNASGTPTTDRTISFNVGLNTLYNPINGHYYEYIASGLSWSSAKAAAAARTFNGMVGYLATVTSAAENEFIRTKLLATAWIGGSDDFAQINAAVGFTLYADQNASEGKWYWVTGPEAGQQFMLSNGSTAPGKYSNWGGSEPNNAGGEHYPQFFTTGQWNDLPNSPTLAYVVEYGGQTGDPVQTLSLTGSRTLTYNPVLQVAENSGLSTYSLALTNISAGPADESTQLVDFIVSNNNGTLFSTPPAIAADGTLTFTLSANAFGSATVTVQSHDDGGTANSGVNTSATKTFTIVINNVNEAPTVTLSTNNVVVLEDVGSVSSNGFATVTSFGAGESSQTLVGHVLTAANTALFSVQPAINNSGVLTFTPALNANGSTTVTVVSQDNGGTSGGGVDKTTNTFTITVTPVNDAPSFVLPSDIPAGPGTVSTLAGSAGQQGTANGTGADARFRNPGGVAVDSAGNVYVTDENHAIRKITPAGEVTTLAGLAGSPGSTDGTGNAARFNRLGDVAVDSAGNLYVVEYGNSTLRKITPGGVVTTLAGLAGQQGTVDGTGSAARFNGPYGVAVDSAGNVYVAEWESHVIRKVTPAGVVTTLAGLANNAGAADGTGSAARFRNPRSMAVDSAGNVFVADFFNHAIRKITPGGVVTTLAGLLESSGSADGTGGTARFRNPSGVAVDSAGNVYVADHNNHTVRKVTPGGVVTTLAGLAGGPGSADGVGSAARFNNPINLAVDSAGNIYVSDYVNHTIRKLTPAVEAAASVVTVSEGSGAFTTNALATSISAGPADESGQTVSFTVANNNNALFSVQPAMAANGTLTFTPAANLFGTATVTVTAVDSGPATAPDVNTSAAQTFTITVANVNEAPTVAFSTNNVVTLEDTATTVNGFASVTSFGLNESSQTLVGHVLTAANTALFSVQPAINTSGVLTFTPALNVHGSTTVAVVSQDSGGTAGGGVDKTTNTFAITITPVNDAPSFALAVGAGGGGGAGTVTTLAGSAPFNGSVDGTGSAARFGYPAGVAVDSAGNVYVGDGDNNLIRKITPAGVVTMLAGTAGPAGSVDGTGAAARFSNPNGVAVDTAGNVYVADTYNHTIRKITPAGVVTTVAGTAGTQGSADGTGPAAQFRNPRGVAVDGAGNLYVTDTSNQLIRMITPAGVVTTLAGSVGATANVDGTGSAARFQNPWGIAVDSAGNLYVGGFYNQTIRKVTPAGVVTTLAGTADTVGSADGTGLAAQFNYPSGVAVDAAGNVYVTDTFNHTIRQVTSAGVVTTVAGLAGASGSADGTSAARFSSPYGITVDSIGNLYVADYGNHTIRKITGVASAAPSGITVNEDSGTFTLALTATNILAGPADEVAAPQLVDFLVSNDNNALFSSQPVIAANGTLTFTPAANAFGSATVTVRAHDDGGTANSGVDTSAAQTFTITVTPVNSAPTITFSTNNVVVLEDVGSVSSNGFATVTSFGLGESGQTLLGHVVTANNTALFSVQPAINTSGVLTFTPALNAVGSTTVTVVSQDSGGTASGGVDKATNTFTITITPVNDVPSFSIASSGNQAIQFDGSNDRVLASANSALDLTTGTIEFWVRPGTLVGNAAILGNRGYTFAATRFSVHMSTSGFLLWNGSSQGTVPFSSTPGQWYHVALVASASNTEVFVNGTSIGFTGNAFNTAVSGQPFTIGASYDGSGSGSLFEPFAGALDEIRIWNTQRSVTELQNNRSQQLIGNETGLVGYWRFNEGSGATTADASPTGNTGTLLGDAAWTASAVPLTPALVANEGSSSQTVASFATSISAGPANEASQVVSFVVTNNNNALFSVQPAISSAGTLTFTPAGSGTGTATVTVYAQDDGGTANGGVDTAGPQSFTIIITPVPTRVYLSGATPAGPQGDTVVVPILLDAIGTESAVGFTLNFDASKLTFVSAANGADALSSSTSNLRNGSQSENGRVGILITKDTGLTFAAGTRELIRMTFTVNSAAALGTTPVTFTDVVTRREVANALANAVPAAFVNGTVTITAATVGTPSNYEGDVAPRPFGSGDGGVTVADTVQISRFAAGLDIASTANGEFQRADCAPLGTKGDGRITVADWLQSQRFAASLDTPGTVGGPTVQAAALLAASAKLPAGTRVVRIVGGNLVSGQANTVTIQMDAQGNEAGVSLSLAFDPTALTFVSASVGTGANGGSLMVNSVKAAAGKVGLVLVLPAGSSLAAGTKDIITVSFTATGSGNTAISLTGDSPVVREVADVNANVLGASFVGGNFNIILPAGLKAAGMERAQDGSLRLVVRNNDGTPVTAAQAAKYVVHVTSNLGGTWTVLPNALVVENGALKIVDPAASAAGLRLYKLVETP